MSEYRSKRTIVYDETRAMLQSQEYTTWRIFVNRTVMYILLIIACNHIARLTNRNAYRVYQNIFRIYQNVLNGSHFKPGRLSDVTLNALIEKDASRECCGWCGKPIGSAPPPDDKSSKPLK